METEIIESLGVRYIGVGKSEGKTIVKGTPGNALGCYLSGGEIEVFGNAQDAVGDTMNDGKIIIHGNAGDALGLSMRGGEIFVEKSVGFRAGVHIKEYKEKVPKIVIGESAGSFLGEYMAGGIIVLLDLKNERDFPDYLGCGMYKGKIFIRSSEKNLFLSPKLSCKSAEKKDIMEIYDVLKSFADTFNKDFQQIIASEFCVITPSKTNVYESVYVSMI